MRATRVLLLLTVLPVSIGCVRETPQRVRPGAAIPEQARPDPPVQPPTEGTGTIGVATMMEDGTIVLRLRAEGASGVRGEGTLTYRPDHAEYESIRSHVGPLRPGQTVPVKPWPDEP
jgi:hypothetical protein